MAQGAAIRRNFPGMERKCTGCDNIIIVTEQMCKYGKYRCAKCLYEYQAAYVRKNREKKRSWNKAYHARNRDKIAAADKRYKKRHPERKAAHQAVQTAIRNGTLIREECTECGCGEAHAHHEDYSKPLEVNWLCHTHHMEHHQLIAERNKAHKE